MFVRGLLPDSCLCDWDVCPTHLPLTPEVITLIRFLSLHSTCHGLLSHLSLFESRSTCTTPDLGFSTCFKACFSPWHVSWDSSHSTSITPTQEDCNVHIVLFIFMPELVGSLAFSRGGYLEMSFVPLSFSA